MKHWTRRAFTLIEMLVVVVVIAILAGIVFRMIAIISRHGDRAATMARIQRVANAVEGFHAEYGQYPPVPFYSGIQPFRYEFANRNGMAPSIALALAGNPSVEWGDGPDEAKVFTFGLMAFLIDRYDWAQQGYNELFVLDQWTEHNDYSAALSARDAAAISRWAPQLAGIDSGDVSGHTYGSGGQAYTNAYRTVRDAWNRELRYSSPPPHQQYKIWTREPGTNLEISSGNWDN